MNRKQRMVAAYNIFEDVAEKIDEAIALLAEEGIDVLRFSIGNIAGVEVHFYAKEIIIPEFAEALGYHSREVSFDGSDVFTTSVEVDTPKGTTKYFQLKEGSKNADIQD